ncbi:hypothetical protein DYB32_006454 [Aphanomyces invadans]|uniref:RxLR effector protein n=1 Tax=Aphanomyces invadans TaxID=157072 RepID=A0A418ARC7_9STRA|nr:hypothetical protein DYB32_006454 [Aphanomyces invadans]
MKCIACFAAAVSCAIAANDGFNANARAPSTNTFRLYLQATENQASSSELNGAEFSDAARIATSGDDDETVWKLLEMAHQQHDHDSDMAFLDDSADDSDAYMSTYEGFVAPMPVMRRAFLDEQYEGGADGDHAFLNTQEEPQETSAIQRLYPVLLALREAIDSSLARSDLEEIVPNPPRFLRDN